MVDSFSKCVAASATIDEESDNSFSKDKKVPGDMIEVWAEKLLYSGYTSLHLLSQLKRGALLGDFNALVNNVRSVKVSLSRDAENVNEQLGLMKLEIQELLGALEESYYSSQHRGQLRDTQASSEIKELCQLALESKMSKSSQ
ncbi:hypothetical protein CEUSTIGMA_g7465.t1 [Chlamydomonas eustigma]|uniref:Uncharacterized protein n=1 Tax=Chlamydomonas eustigma TaxID=1157962 RepID=A0A250XAG0_9CHLO|nr:hypothetical protein CEUSTIGMA_g7465.t1 [Chlamydomonas eustigma]|eukprot:GAX80026.1 hypothetical protein CEUSTIGMA_g7465.t1 [Chlamydomonas eustigma]